LNRYTTAFKGILTLITFLLDPVVFQSIKSAYSYLKNRK
jgi:hypothetical protein